MFVDLITRLHFPCARPKHSDSQVLPCDKVGRRASNRFLQKLLVCELWSHLIYAFASSLHLSFPVSSGGMKNSHHEFISLSTVSITSTNHKLFSLSQWWKKKNKNKNKNHKKKLLLHFFLVFQDEVENRKRVGGVHLHGKEHKLLPGLHDTSAF